MVNCCLLFVLCCSLFNGVAYCVLRVVCCYVLDCLFVVSCACLLLVVGC